MLSATMPNEVLEVTSRFMRAPIRILDKKERDVIIREFRLTKKMHKGGLHHVRHGPEEAIQDHEGVQIWLILCADHCRPQFCSVITRGGRIVRNNMILLHFLEVCAR